MPVLPSKISPMGRLIDDALEAVQIDPANLAALIATIPFQRADRKLASDNAAA